MDEVTLKIKGISLFCSDVDWLRLYLCELSKRGRVFIRDIILIVVSTLIEVLMLMSISSPVFVYGCIGILFGCAIICNVRHFLRYYGEFKHVLRYGCIDSYILYMTCLPEGAVHFFQPYIFDGSVRVVWRPEDRHLYINGENGTILDFPSVIDGEQFLKDDVDVIVHNGSLELKKAS